MQLRGIYNKQETVITRMHFRERHERLTCQHSETFTLVAVNSRLLETKCQSSVNSIHRVHREVAYYINKPQSLIYSELLLGIRKQFGETYARATHTHTHTHVRVCARAHTHTWSIFRSTNSRKAVLCLKPSLLEAWKTQLDSLSNEEGREKKQQQQ